ncbi:MAG: hypothetical protein NVS3B21_34680 [Acidimicrobiales bacterium]
MDLVDDVDLPAARGTEGDAGQQVPHLVELAVRRGIELVDVDGAATADLDARVARAAGLTVLHADAVEGHGEDAGGRGLAGAPRTAEQVGVDHLARPHRIEQGPSDVILTPHVGEELGPEPAVQRLIGLGGVGWLRH